MENGKRRAFEAIIDPEEDMFWDIFNGKIGVPEHIFE